MKSISKIILLLAICSLLSRCGEDEAHKVIVIGVDGMDYKLLKAWIDEGVMPNLEALAREGDFSALGTSIPPESPVAWSNFITGRNPGGHGVFDFMHKDWEGGTFNPRDSVAGSDPVTRSLSMFGYEFPLAGGDSYNKRRGTAFWEVLEEHGVPATIFKIPANYPPSPTGQKTLSGMGTPDAQGGYGTYYVYSDEDGVIFSDRINVGKVKPVTIIDNKFTDFIYGPINPAIAGEEKPMTTSPLTVYIDPDQPVVKIVVGDEDSDPAEIILEQGQWSEFISMDFEIIPWLSSVSGCTRFYLKSVRPDFTLFVDPININPYEPIPDISTPSSWAGELAERNGYFYTKGMPEDTKALEEGVLTYDEYRQQTLMIYEKRKEMLLDMVNRHDSGLLFYYFCSIDLDSHMFWRCMDSKHPGHDEEEGNENFIKWLYTDLDKTLGEVRKQLDEDDTLIIMSDHGFAPYYRSFNLNTWLLENGYAALKEGEDRESSIFFQGVDWSKTKAYNLGFACLYLNIKGRDAQGIVDPADADDLVDELCSKLLKVTDPESGERVFLRIYKTRDTYSGEALDEAPEIIVGCRAEYRVSNESAQGMFPEGVIHDNMDPWSGCHLMAAEEVPGILLSNKKIRLEDPKLYDLTVTVLKEYGIEKLPEMIGRPIF